VRKIVKADKNLEIEEVSVNVSEALERTFSQNPVWFALVVAVVLLGSVYGLTRWSRRTGGNVRSVATEQKGAETQQSDKTISYRGVTFSYFSSLAYEVKAETKSAYRLELSSDTGQGVVPDHIVFELLGSYRSSHQESYFSPRILIFPIESYRQALSKSPQYVNLFDHKVDTLREMLSQQPSSWDGEVPVLPFAIGGSQLFHARLAYVKFKTGTGVVFLTHYNIEPALVNNRGLTYMFQGLTDDRRYWVSAMFPVSIPFLPERYDSERSDEYALVIPKRSSKSDYESFEKGYQVYLGNVVTRLDHAASPTYEPDLDEFKRMIESMYVKPEF
jgi:hypothetical protein